MPRKSAAEPQGRRELESVSVSVSTTVPYATDRLLREDAYRRRLSRAEVVRELLVAYYAGTGK